MLGFGSRLRRRRSSQRRGTSAGATDGAQADAPGERRSDGRTHVDTVWSLDEIVERNLRFWSDSTFAQLYMSFDALLFFGDNGGGDQFAFVQRPYRPDVFVWEHESDSRRWVANNLRDYLGRSLRAAGDDWYQL